MWLQAGQGANCRGLRRSCERRLPVREFECLRLGTAMTDCLCYFYLIRFFVSRELAYQLAAFNPGIMPSLASSRSLMREMPNLR